MKKIIIPKVDANIEEGSLGQWAAGEGDHVRKGQLLVEYITDKAVYEIEAPASGILRRIVAPPKSVVPIGSVIGLIGKPEEVLPDVEAENRRILERHRQALDAVNAPEPDVAPARKAAAQAGRPRATPAARRLARIKGISLERLHVRSGGQLITAEMVENFSKSTKSLVDPTNGSS